MATVRSARFTTRGQDKILTLTIDDIEDLAPPLQGQLALHDDIAVIWCASFGCEKLERRAEWLSA